MCDFKVSKNFSVLLLLSYYFITATMYIPVYIDTHVFIKNRYKYVEFQIYLKIKKTH